MQVGDVTERVKEFFQDEYNAMTLYRELAEIEGDDEMKRRLMEISAMERSHHGVLEEFLGEEGREGGGRRAGFKIRYLKFPRRVLGLPLISPSLHYPSP
ncbi:hypothetical protein J7L60_04490 [Candidatus Bathyarchaeota archaeon]|nr:hypothetical protein [Candidatus Bathyarchaeota archaeon]